MPYPCNELIVHGGCASPADVQQVVWPLQAVTKEAVVRFEVRWKLPVQSARDTLSPLAHGARGSLGPQAPGRRTPVQRRASGVVPHVSRAPPARFAPLGGLVWLRLAPFVTCWVGTYPQCTVIHWDSVVHMTTSSSRHARSCMHVQPNSLVTAALHRSSQKL